MECARGASWVCEYRVYCRAECKAQAFLHGMETLLGNYHRQFATNTSANTAANTANTATTTTTTTTVPGHHCHHYHHRQNYHHQRRNAWAFNQNCPGVVLPLWRGNNSLSPICKAALSPQWLCLNSEPCRSDSQWYSIEPCRSDSWVVFYKAM